ncbi:MAG: SulP family inorganic anion transporter [Candidatus Nanopelagicales bacterium]
MEVDAQQGLDAERRPWPVLSSFAGYHRSWLAGDLLAGLTFAALALPSQLAIATLAGMPTVTGLYTFLAGALATILLARTGALVLCAEGAIAPVIAAGLATAAALGATEYARMAGTVALLVGVMLVAVVLLRATWLADLLSRSVIVGLMAGLSVIVIISQIPAALGLSIQATTTPSKAFEVLHELGDVNWLSVALFVVGLVMLRLGWLLGPRFPLTLLVVVIGGLATAVLGLRDAGLPTVGSVPSGLPAPHLPALSDLKFLLPTALAIMLLALAQTAAVSRQANEHNTGPDATNGDLRALAGANLFASVLGGFPASASVTSTRAAINAGARSQLAALVAAVVVAAVLVFGGGLLEYLPTATLAAVLVTVAITIVDVPEIRRIARFSKRTLAVTLGTAAAVVVFGVEIGVLVAVVYTLLERVERTARPLVVEMGRLPGADRSWRPIYQEPEARRRPGVIVLRLGGPLWFGNANWFAADVRAAALGLKAQMGPGALAPVVVLDFSGVTDIDYTGATALRRLAEWCNEQGVKFAVATALGWSSKAVARADLERDIGEVYERIDHAVAALAGSDSRSGGG